MPNKCDWPTCGDPATHGIHCFNHNRIYGTKATAKVQQALSIPDLTEKAQKVFNTWIRNRDRAFGCITCGNEVQEAGHYIAVGSNTALRFHPYNNNGQCHHCNSLKGGNLKEYRVALIIKIGIDNVLFLEQYPKFYRYSRQELQNIIEKYSVLECEI